MAFRLSILFIQNGAGESTLDTIKTHLQTPKIRERFLMLYMHHMLTHVSPREFDLAWEHARPDERFMDEGLSALGVPHFIWTPEEDLIRKTP